MRKLNAALCFIICISINVISLAQSSIERFTTSINGTIICSDVITSAMISSENGKFSCTYDIVAVTDEMRELSNLKLFEKSDLILTLSKVPGSDLHITNSGKLVFYDHSEHYKGMLTLHIYSNTGSHLINKSFKSADQFEYSPSGEMIGVRTSDGLSILSLDSGYGYSIEKGLQFSFDETDQFIAVAQTGKILIYAGSNLINTIQTAIELPRKTILSSQNNLVGIIDKYHLKVYSLSNTSLLFEDKIAGDISFRDLKFVDDKIVAGIHKKNKEESTGILREYDLNGNILKEKTGQSRLLQRYERLNLEKKSKTNYDPIPWPFFPFDSMRTVWNHYEQHMGLGGSSSYMHQGLDLITPIGEPTYSVIDGFVKLVLTTGGDIYWRTAISPVQVSGRSDGWLSAHLIETTIQVDIGDTVQIHDYLGDIIQWSVDWGHIHFVNISDSGLVWYYSDDEWGINFSPILALQPYPDVIPPSIEQVFPWSKFAFAKNESAVYLQPDSLFGQIDIIVKVVDYVGTSLWQQPAYTTWYTVKKISNGQIIKPRTLGHILNHKYPFYDSGWYMEYAGVIYQRDNTLLPSGWMDMNRNFYHNLTNSNGDSLIELSEKALAFNTDYFEDGDYRIIIEVYDEAGNYDIDSMNVKFKNGNPVSTEDEASNVYSFNLDQNYPNPFNPSTKIKFSVPPVIASGEKQSQLVTLKVYDVLGNEIAILVNEEKPAGEYEVEFNTSSINHHPSSGIFFYQLKAGSFIQTKKMVLLK